MGDEPKTGTGMMVKEIAYVMPQTDKEAAGRDLGVAFRSVGSIARDLSGFLAGIVSIPRRTRDFISWAFSRYRQISDERRRAPSTRLLLEAAQGYATADDEDLRACFERLIESAMDSKTASAVHPSFITFLSQLSGDDARFLRLVQRGGRFERFGDLCEAGGISCNGQGFELMLQNLERLGLIEVCGPTTIRGGIELDPFDPPAGGNAGVVHFDKPDHQPMTKVVADSAPHFARLRYCLTLMGAAFLVVVT